MSRPFKISILCSLFFVYCSLLTAFPANAQINQDKLDSAQSACPEGLSEDECQNFQQGAVAAGRVEPIIASAGEDRTILTGEEVLFSAKDSRFPSYLDKEEIEYWWNFGDMSALERGEEVKHIYNQTGNYQVKLELRTSEGSVEDDMLLKAVDKALFLIIGEDQDVFSRINILNQAERLGFLVYIVAIKEEGHDFVIEDQLVNTLLERIGDIRRSDLIIGWTKNSVEVNALLRLGHRLEDKSVFIDKSLVIAADSIGLISRRAQPIYDTLLPKNVLLVQPELIEKAVEGESKAQLIKEVQSQGKGFVLLGVHSRRNFGKVAFYNFLSHFINSLINRGVSINTILLILMLPLVATVITFARQVVGIKAFGIYIPTILTLTFAAIGIQAGFLIIILILAIGTLIRFVFKRLRLLYLPRMALIITVISISMLVLFYFSAHMPNLSLISVSIFPILILIMLSEEFVKVQIEEGVKNALILTGETLVLSIVSFYIVNWAMVRNLLLSYPEIILITFIINLILGKWTGLRLWELYRFKEVIKAVNIIEDKIKKK